MPCPICRRSIGDSTVSSDIYRFECPKCGIFRMNGDDYEDIFKHIANDPQVLAILSHKVRRSQTNNVAPIWTLDQCINVVKNSKLPSVYEQFDGALEWLGRNTKYPGEELILPSLELQAFAGCLNRESIHYVFQFLASQLYVTYGFSMGGGEKLGTAVMMAAGWIRYDEITRGGIAYNKAFMAMKYGDQILNKIFEESFKPAVKQTGFELFKLDDKPEAGLIDIRMRQEITTSKFVVADLTHDNLGAYWEAGFAEGKGKHVFYTCEKDKFEKAKTHFDVNHHLTIKWDPKSPGQASEDLKAAIRYTFPEATQEG
jgi:hypothetical protein